MKPEMDLDERTEKTTLALTIKNNYGKKYSHRFHKHLYRRFEQRHRAGSQSREMAGLQTWHPMGRREDMMGCGCLNAFFLLFP